MSALREARLTRVGVFLNELQTIYHRRDLLSSDPLEFVHLFDDPWDQEAVALVAALLAYGNVKQVRKSVSDVLQRMAKLGGSPAQVIRNLQEPDFKIRADREFSSFVHRFNQGADLVLLFELLSRSWLQYGSMGAHFLLYLNPEEQDITQALSQLIADWRAWAGKRKKGRDSFQYLLTSPEDGSCCKRWCMLLRWMGRKDELDPGLWTSQSKLLRTFPEGKSLKSSQLILPLDTHTGRISQYLGLTQRKTLDWRAALEITQSLGVCDSNDPTRYDFALSRLGILAVCKSKYREEICGRCQLVGACKFAQKRIRVNARKANKLK
jgi:uncharacterized protein (TIGR02757 family)